MSTLRKIWVSANKFTSLCQSIYFQKLEMIITTTLFCVIVVAVA